jgi:hypothetical protein
MSRSFSFTLNVSGDGTAVSTFYASLATALAALSTDYDVSSAPYYYREVPIALDEVVATKEFVDCVDSIDKTGLTAVGCDITRNFIHW